MNERLAELPYFPKLFVNELDFRERDITNLSGFEPWELEGMNLRHLLSLIPAESMVVFPDVSPTEVGLIPTGVMATFNPERTPHWRQFIRGADIGCGMLTSQLSIQGSQFKKSQQELNAVMDGLRHAGLRSCFRGNHFINFAQDVESGQVMVVIHTGSQGDLQIELGRYVDNPEKYNQMYATTISSAQETRANILRVIEKIYGTAQNNDDVMHNTIETDSETGFVTVYKGVIKVGASGQKVLLPSSASGLMAVCSITDRGSEVGGTSHGTGRRHSRGQMKEIMRNALVAPSLPPSLMTPTGMSWPPTELDDAYHPLDRTLDIFSLHGLIKDDYQIYEPIAGIKGD